MVVHNVRPALALQGKAFGDVVKAIITAGGPVDNATKAESVRLHDDKVNM